MFFIYEKDAIMENKKLELYKRLSKQPHDKNLTIRISGETKALFMAIEKFPSNLLREFIIDRIVDNIDKIEEIEMDNRYDTYDPNIDFIRTSIKNINTTTNNVKIISKRSTFITNHNENKPENNR